MSNNKYKYKGENLTSLVNSINNVDLSSYFIGLTTSTYTSPFLNTINEKQNDLKYTYLNEDISKWSIANYTENTVSKPSWCTAIRAVLIGGGGNGASGQSSQPQSQIQRQIQNQQQQQQQNAFFQNFVHQYVQGRVGSTDRADQGYRNGSNQQDYIQSLVYQTANGQTSLQYIVRQKIHDHYNYDTQYPLYRDRRHQNNDYIQGNADEQYDVYTVGTVYTTGQGGGGGGGGGFVYLNNCAVSNTTQMTVQVGSSGQNTTLSIDSTSYTAYAGYSGSSTSGGSGGAGTTVYGQAGSSTASNTGGLGGLNGGTASYLTSTSSLLNKGKGGSGGSGGTGGSGGSGGNSGDSGYCRIYYLIS